MKFIKEITGRIFAVWAMLVFVITMLPVVLLMWLIGLLKEPNRTAAFRIISKTWMNIFFFLVGCRLKIKGIENFEKGKTYIVISNHNSLMDVPITTPFIPGANKTIAKIEMSKIPLFGLIYKRGSVLVDRKDKDSRRDSFRKMREVLDMGIHMCIYPEGTRNKSDDPYSFLRAQPGVGKLIMDARPQVIPVFIAGLCNDLPKQIARNWNREEVIRIYFGEQLELSGHLGKPDRLRTHKEIADFVMEKIAELAEQDRAVGK